MRSPAAFPSDHRGEIADLHLVVRSDAQRFEHVKIGQRQTAVAL